MRLPDGKLPDDPRTRKIDTADLSGAPLTAGDLGCAYFAARNAGSRFGFKRFNLGPRHINVIGVRRRQCVPADGRRAIGKTLVTIVVTSSRETVWATRYRTDIE